MIIRKYEPSYCKTIAELFYNTVHIVNAKDYSESQLNAWATGEVDLTAWNNSFLEHYTLVAFDGDTLIGFGDIDKTGYLDRLYVHKDFQGRGVASALCRKLESAFAVKKISVHASVTAKPFFEKQGYIALKEQQVQRRGVYLTNYLMEKSF